MLHLEAQVAQHECGRLTHCIIIVVDEQRAPVQALTGTRRRRYRSLGDGLSADRKPNSERGTTALAARHFETCVMPAYDPERDGQSEATAKELGGKERFEH